VTHNNGVWRRIQWAGRTPAYVHGSYISKVIQPTINDEPVCEGRLSFYNRPDVWSTMIMSAIGRLPPIEGKTANRNSTTTYLREQEMRTYSYAYKRCFYVGGQRPIFSHTLIYSMGYSIRIRTRTCEKNIGFARGWPVGYSNCGTEIDDSITWWNTRYDMSNLSNPVFSRRSDEYYPWDGLRNCQYPQCH